MCSSVMSAVGLAVGRVQAWWGSVFGAFVGDFAFAGAGSWLQACGFAVAGCMCGVGEVVGVGGFVECGGGVGNGGAAGFLLCGV